MSVKKCIAYRTKDMEGDVWSEVVFLFDNREQVKDFFVLDNPDLIEIFTDGDENDNISNFEVTVTNGLITHVTFSTKYAGEVNISEMLEGYIYQR